MVYIVYWMIFLKPIKLPKMEKTHLVRQAEALNFIMGGNALFTVLHHTGKRYTYKVLQDQRKETIFKVMVLYGPDNSTNYKQFGEINVESGVPLFRKFFTRDHAEFFDIIFLNISIGKEIPGIEIYHSGRCCRCGRTLTVPESIVSGIGPECAFKTSILRKIFQL